MNRNLKKIHRTNALILLGLFILLAFVHYFYGQNAVKSVFSTWLPLSGKVIVLDPGHGGIDGGASFNNVLEKNINLEVCLKLRKMLEKEGANVIMTRTEDTALDHLNKKDKYRHRRDLISRVDIINMTSPDIFLSIHVNADTVSSKTSGPMVFYYRTSAKSREFAQILQQKMEDAYKLAGQNPKARKPVGSLSLFLLKNTNFPGIIAELGFITNADDRRLLTSSEFQQKISEAIVSALKEYFDS